MPIKDYCREADQTYENLLQDPNITPTNLEAVRLFADAYNVKAATKAKFWKHLQLFLRQSQDIRKEMHDPAIINKTFKTLETTLSPGYFATVINCTNRFVKWLNDDVKPRGFKDVKSPSKKTQRRALDRADMWSWEDGLEAIKYATSTQIKAAVMLQLNLGARPSEFIDLRYGDIESKGDFMVIHIRAGKTGPRSPLIYYATGHLAAWMNEHPTRNPKDPLWVVEQAEKSHRRLDKGGYDTGSGVRKYEYASLKSRIREIALKAGINKPCDLYTLRHSCARLLRLWKVPIEQCAKQLGHSVKEFNETYGRLDQDDDIRIQSEAFGVLKEQEDLSPDKPRSCKKCGLQNRSGTDFCGRCGAALDLKKALAEEDETYTKIAALVYEKLKAEKTTTDDEDRITSTR